MEVHIRNLGAACIGLGIVSAVAGLLFFTVLDREALLADFVPNIVTMVWIVLMGALAVPLVVAGIGLLRLRSWARPFGMVLSTFSLMIVPLGTVVGLYGLWVLISPEADQVFSPRFDGNRFYKP